MKKFLVVLALLLIPSLVAAGITSTTTWVPGQNTKIIQVHWTTDSFSSCPMARIDDVNGFVFSILSVPNGVIEATTGAYLYGVTSGYDYTEGGLTVDGGIVSMDNYSPFKPIYEHLNFSVFGAGDLESGDYYINVQVPK